MREAVICEPLRTPVGGFGGVFRDVSVGVLASSLLAELLARTALPPAAVEDVLLGQGYPNGEAPALGRVAALDAGLPVEVPGLQVDRRCGAGLQAITLGAMEVQTGAAELVIAGGAESMSQAEYYATDVRWGARSGEVEFADRLARGRVTAGGLRHPVPGGMIETAENVRRMYGIGRAEQDEFALRSHELALAAQRDGTFAEEIVPITLERRGQKSVVELDEHPRADTSLQRLAALTPMMARSDPEATVTAGNSSGQNDGAAMCVITHPERARELGLRPLARLVSWAVAGVAPELMGMGPVPASARALERAGLQMADIDLIELNEAFAAQALGVLREWDLPDGLERVNVHGSGISLGHPIGATGARILTTLLRELRRRGARYGLETMCIGGGQGMAAIFEAVQ